MTAEPLPIALIAMNYFGDIVFAFSGALVAARHRMDILGIVLIGMVTGIGGGTLRDIILGHPVWWVQNPIELVLCTITAILAYFVKHVPLGREGLAKWADAVGLATFAVVGAHVAQQDGASLVVVAFLGMMTATGGGVIRDLLTQTRPMILSGEIYATAALIGAAAYAVLSRYGWSTPWRPSSPSRSPLSPEVLQCCFTSASVSWESRLSQLGGSLKLARRRTRDV
jgi:uncharacterized membrane protein YeiH